MAVTADVRIPMRPLTVDDYERMVEAGILGEDDRVELLNGHLAEMSPEGPEHAGLIQWLSTKLVRAIDPEVAGVRMALPLRLAPRSMPEPDIAVVAPGINTRAHPAGSMLAIEVACSSRRIDLGVKAEIYAAAGVEEYWVVDIRRRTVHVHDTPVGGRYENHRELTSGSLRPSVADAPTLDVRALFALLD